MTSLLHCLSRPGPSLLARRTLCPSCARHASTSTSSPSPSDAPPIDALTSPAAPEDGAKLSAADAAKGEDNAGLGVDAREVQESVDGALKPGYKNWLGKIGRQYREPKDGPNWLGGHIPFPTNPSFRPPPPLSDMLREMIYLDSLGYSADPAIPSTGLSVARLSEKYGVSKKRIEAVIRLKREEKLWEKSGKVLQTPFLKAMEKHLAVRTPRAASAAMIANMRSEKTERDQRLLHPSSAIEAGEEAAHETAVREARARGHEGDASGDDTAFSARDTIRRPPGMEHGAWEYKDEELVAGTMARAREALARGTADPGVEFRSPAFETPYTRPAAAPAVDAAAEVHKREEAAPAVVSGKAAYRFIDTSGVKGKRESSASGVKEYRRKRKMEKREAAYKDMYEKA